MEYEETVVSLDLLLVVHVKEMDVVVLVQKCGRLVKILTVNLFMKASQDSIKFSDCSEGYQGLNADLLSKQRCNISNSNTNHTDDTEWSSDNQCQATYRGTLCLAPPLGLEFR